MYQTRAEMVKDKDEMYKKTEEIEGMERSRIEAGLSGKLSSS